MSDKCGDSTARYLGRITINPAAHIDPMGAIIMLFMPFGWGKPVPVNTLNLHHPRRDMALTSVAGPIMNFLLAYVVLVIEKIVMYTTIKNGSFITLDGFAPGYYIALGLYYIFSISICLGIFNLIPIPPLDGFGILQYFLPDKYLFWVRNHQTYITIVFFAIIIFTDVLSPLIGGVQRLFFNLYDFLTGYVDLAFGG
jgi:Zn-dependent protease